MDSYVGYHGTDSCNVDSIKKHGFRASTSYNEWLGYGIYFFIDGAFCPITCAHEWGANSAWDKSEGRYKYLEYSILKAVISGERTLDLRIQEDLKIFDRLRDHILTKYLDNRASNKSKLMLHPDTFLCNAASKSMGLDILIQNLYIKTKRQRIKKIDSRIPNTTVLCAKKSAVINIADIEEYEKSGVRNE